MPNSDYWPTRFSDWVPFFQNLAAQAATHSVTLSLTAAQLLQLNNDRDSVIMINDATNAAAAYAQEVTAYRRLMFMAPLNTPLPPAPTLPPALVLPVGAQAAIQARTRKLIEQIKNHINYTLAIGQSLGIVGTPAVLQNVEIEELTALANSQIEVRVFKGGYSTVALFCSVNGGPMAQVVLMTTAVYIHGAPPQVPGASETRDYQCQAYADNQLTGPVSATLRAVTNP